MVVLKMIKDYKWCKTRAWCAAFISVLLILLSIFLTPDFVAKNLSPDGIIGQKTIFYIISIRLGSCTVGAIGILISMLYIIKPSIFITFRSVMEHILILWKPRLKYMLFLFPIVFTLCTILVKIYYPYWYRELMWREDSVIEWLTFIFYFIAFVVSLDISITYYSRNQTLFCLMYTVLTLGLFFIAGEEISWGQRILQISTPVFFKNYNVQNEINVHNLKGVGFAISMLYVIVGFYGAFARFIIPKKVKIKYRSVVNLFVPDYYLFFYFFIVGFLYLYYDHLSRIAATLFGDSFGITYVSKLGASHFLIGKDQEPAEYLLSDGFFLFVIINKYRQVRDSAINNQTTA